MVLAKYLYGSPVTDSPYTELCFAALMNDAIVFRVCCSHCCCVLTVMAGRSWKKYYRRKDPSPDIIVSKSPFPIFLQPITFTGWINRKGRNRRDADGFTCCKLEPLYPFQSLRSDDYEPSLSFR